MSRAGNRGEGQGSLCYHGSDAPAYGMLRRTALVERILAHDEPVQLFIAAPGFGASTIMRQCAEHWRSNAPVDWIDSRRDEGVERLSRAIAMSGQSHLLCVDAPDGVSREQIKELAAVLLRASPPRLMVATHDTTLLDQLPCRHAVFDSAALRLSDEEIALLLKGHDGLAPEIINTAEGWPLALDMMRRALHEPGVTSIADPIKDVPQIEEFFSEAVWPKLPPDAAEILAIAAFLESNFSIDLLIWLTEDADAWRKIEPAVTAELFVYRVSDRSNIYRIHPLFGAFLRDAARLPASVDRDAVLGRACEWFRGQRRWDRAIHYAALREDSATIIAIAEQAGGWKMLGGGGLQSVGRALDALPELAMRSDPQIRELLIVSALKAGRNCQNLPNAEDPLVQILVAFYQDQLRGKYALQLLSQTRDRIGCSDPVAYAVLSSMMCLTHIDGGALDACDCEARRAIDILLKAEHPGGTAYLQTFRARTATLRGNLDEADAHIGRVFALGWEPMVEVAPVMQLASVQAAAIALERGDTAKARRLMAEGWPFFSSSDGWYDVLAEAIATSVRIALNDGRPAEALRVIADGEAIARDRGLPRLQLVAASWRVVVVVGSREAASIEAAIDALNALREQEDVGLDEPGHYLSEAIAFAESSYAFWRGMPGAACDRMLREAERARAIGAMPLRRRALIWAAMAADRAGGRSKAAQLASDGLDGITDTKMLKVSLPFAGDMVPLLSDMLGRNAMSELHAPIVRPVVDAIAANMTTDWLTVREEEILDLVGAGMANKEIARRLSISDNTVKFHRKNIYAKLGVNRRSRALQILHDHRSQQTTESYGSAT